LVREKRGSSARFGEPKGTAKSHVADKQCERGHPGGNHTAVWLSGHLVSPDEDWKVCLRQLFEDLAKRPLKPLDAGKEVSEKGPS